MVLNLKPIPFIAAIAALFQHGAQRHLEPWPGAKMHFGLTPNVTQPTRQKPQYSEAGLTEDPVWGNEEKELTGKEQSAFPQQYPHPDDSRVLRSAMENVRFLENFNFLPAVSLH